MSELRIPLAQMSIRHKLGPAICVRTFYIHFFIGHVYSLDMLYLASLVTLDFTCLSYGFLDFFMDIVVIHWLGVKYFYKIHSKLRIITHVAIKVHVVLQSFVVLT